MFGRTPTPAFEMPSFQAIAAATQTPTGKARKRHFRYASALHALQIDRNQKAVEILHKLLHDDPGCTDAWIALAYLGRGNGELYRPYWRALALSADRIGEERAQLADNHAEQALAQLADSFRLVWRPFGRLFVPTQSANDLRGGYARLLLDEHADSEAAEWIEQLQPGFAQTALRIELALRGGDRLRAVQLLQQITNQQWALASLDEWREQGGSVPVGLAYFLDAQLLLADCYLALDQAELAVQTYRELIELIGGVSLPPPYAQLELEVRYLLAATLEQLGEQDAAERELRLIFARDASYADVAARLLPGTHQETERASDLFAADDETAAIIERMEAEFRGLDIPRFPDD